MADVNQGIINYGSIGGDASVRIVQHHNELAHASRALAGSGLEPAVLGQLTAQIAEMQAALGALRKDQVASGNAVSGALKSAIAEVAQGNSADAKGVQVSAKGLVEAAKGVAEVMPIALKIAGTIAATFGFVL
jgi:hypothetical protein